ncbi:uncharacterized protein STEHIDRAFT_135914 [Stereum hirsutum FP-91666 SS1]|uniref:Uncharacterized protein n=1 Tax=Stereum hirsutum (strain FP-91666) TaxID=721885 RepID=R7RVH1_STEHR|nr:uncharacterized protein STEHIDRAFT_135914 [Stereum hirsutum FP-91666 SS1]EIM79026.1 hypothetical protein STEHIDRAFT_135914 [Stereum hirsutum FP-91666 SS1]
MCAWNQDDPRMLSTEMMPDKIKCMIEVVHFPEMVQTFDDNQPDVPNLSEDEHFALVIKAEFLYGWVEHPYLISPPAILDTIYSDWLGGFGPDWGNMLEVAQWCRRRLQEKLRDRASRPAPIDLNDLLGL